MCASGAPTRSGMFPPSTAVVIIVSEMLVAKEFLMMSIS